MRWGNHTRNSVKERSVTNYLQPTPSEAFVRERSTSRMAQSEEEKQETTKGE